MTALAKQLESCLWERLHYHIDRSLMNMINATDDTNDDVKNIDSLVDLPTCIDHLEKALEVARTLEKANGMAYANETVLLAE